MRHLLLALLLAIPLGAQDGPKRPSVADGADPNDWRSYYAAGVKQYGISPLRAADDFWWASRLSPSSPEPLHARWVALWLANPRLLEEAPRRGSPEEQVAIRIDSLLYEAFAIDPFTPRQYTRLIYDALPGYYGNDSFTNGFLAYTEGRYDLARSHLRRATGGRNAREARYYRALSWQAQQRYDSAAAELVQLAAMARAANDRATRRIYDSPAVYELGVGIARLRMKDFAGARQALLAALDEDVSLAAAHVALAQVADAEGKGDERLEEWRQAMELRPSSGVMHDGYATALRAAGQKDRAATEYEQAIRLEPHWSAPYFNLALVLEELGRPAEAAQRYAQFVERAPLAYAPQRALAERKARELAGR